MPTPLQCPPTDTPGEERTNFILRRPGQGAPDGRGGYTDAGGQVDVAAYCGYEAVRGKQGAATHIIEQGATEVPQRVVIFEGLPGLDIRTDDQLIEAVDDGTLTHNVIEKAGGDRLIVRDVRHYDDQTQVDTTHVLPA